MRQHQLIRRALRFILILAAAGLLLSPGPILRADSDGGKIDWQKTADTARWSFPAERTDSIFCIFESEQGYGLRIDVSENNHLEARYTITRGGRDLASWTTQSKTTFRIIGGALYYAAYHSSTEGGKIVCVDLATGRERWRSALVGLGRPIEHSAYSNRIAIDVNNDVVTVYGDELFGRYIEFKDCQTGQTVGHTVFSAEPATRPAER